MIISVVSAYCNTGMLAERIADVIRDSGDLDVLIYDMVEADAAEVERQIQ